MPCMRGETQHISIQLKLHFYFHENKQSEDISMRNAKSEERPRFKETSGYI